MLFCSAQFRMSKIPLVIFNKQLGDVLLMEPALSKLAASTGGTVALATRPAFAPMVSLMEGVTPARRLPVEAAARVIACDPRFKAWFRALLTRSNEKWLYVTRPKHLRWWHRIAYRTGCEAVNEDDFYRARYFFDLMPGDSAFPFRPPRLSMPPGDWLPSGLPERYVLLHPTAAWKRKSWPVDSWAAVLQGLHDGGVGPFVLTGGRDSREQQYAAVLARKAAVPLINLCGQTPLTAYLAVVSRAGMVLCVDGSATHLATAFQRPAVTLFGPTHPIHWHYPSPDSVLIDARRYVEERKPALEHIPVDAVLKGTMALWNRINS